ncbi:hypothetical protein BJY52DRAFT_1225069 [Lactarius psammicola]|nr:hypothetical protein BJY52DRAFT_1225069 [Lactarius psammicola]
MSTHNIQVIARVEHIVQEKEGPLAGGAAIVERDLALELDYEPLAEALRPETHDHETVLKGPTHRARAHRTWRRTTAADLARRGSRLRSSPPPEAEGHSTLSYACDGRRNKDGRRTCGAGRYGGAVGADGCGLRWEEGARGLCVGREEREEWLLNGWDSGGEGEKKVTFDEIASGESFSRRKGYLRMPPSIHLHLNDGARKSFVHCQPHAIHRDICISPSFALAAMLSGTAVGWQGRDTTHTIHRVDICRERDVQDGVGTDKVGMAHVFLDTLPAELVAISTRSHVAGYLDYRKFIA